MSRECLADNNLKKTEKVRFMELVARNMNVLYMNEGRSCRYRELLNCVRQLFVPPLSHTTERKRLCIHDLILV
jgi:hypothetical protein